MTQTPLSQDEYMRPQMEEAEGQLSRALSELPFAPYTVNITAKEGGRYTVLISNSKKPDSERNRYFRDLETMMPRDIEDLALIVKGYLYNAPPPQPEVDLSEIDKQMSELRVTNERLVEKLRGAILSSAKWEMAAKVAEAKLATVRLVTLSTLEPKPEV